MDKKTKDKIYRIVALYVLITFIILTLLTNIFCSLLVLGFCLFVTAMGNYGKSGYTAHRRKNEWVRKDGVVCHARKWEWDVSPEEIPEGTVLFIFLTIYSIVVIPTIAILLSL